MITSFNPVLSPMSAPTGPVSLAANQKMSRPLQNRLLKFGMAYAEAEGKVNKLKGAKHFGLKKCHDSFNMLFPEDILDLEDDPGYEMASLKPRGPMTFDMLQQTPVFGKKLSMKDPKTVKAYLRKLLETV